MRPLGQSRSYVGRMSMVRQRAGEPGRSLLLARFLPPDTLEARFPSQRMLVPCLHFRPAGSFSKTLPPVGLCLFLCRCLRTRRGSVCKKCGKASWAFSFVLHRSGASSANSRSLLSLIVDPSLPFRNRAVRAPNVPERHRCIWFSVPLARATSDYSAKTPPKTRKSHALFI